VESIALACAPDVERRLIDLLAGTIAECEALVGTSAAPTHLAAAERALPRLVRPGSSGAPKT
jgi:ADP-heptose:LPS heptosyltransferase